MRAKKKLAGPALRLLLSGMLMMIEMSHAATVDINNSSTPTYGTEKSSVLFQILENSTTVTSEPAASQAPEKGTTSSVDSQTSEKPTDEMTASQTTQASTLNNLISQATRRTTSVEPLASTIAKTIPTSTTMSPKPKCFKLEDPQHGTIRYYGFPTSVGTVVKYTCKTGYMLSGTKSRTCESNGRWSNYPPTCHDETKQSSSTPAPDKFHPQVFQQHPFWMGTFKFFGQDNAFNFTVISVDLHFYGKLTGEFRTGTVSMVLSGTFNIDFSLKLKPTEQSGESRFDNTDWALWGSMYRIDQHWRMDGQVHGNGFGYFFMDPVDTDKGTEEPKTEVIPHKKNTNKATAVIIAVVVIVGTATLAMGLVFLIKRGIIHFGSAPNAPQLFSNPLYEGSGSRC